MSCFLIKTFNSVIHELSVLGLKTVPYGYQFLSPWGSNILY